MLNGNSIVLEYSMQQKAFHRTTVNRMLQHNLKMVGEWVTTTGYIPIGLFETNEECDLFYNQVLPIISQLEERPELSQVTAEQLLASLGDW